MALVEPDNTNFRDLGSQRTNGLSHEVMDFTTQTVDPADTVTIPVGVVRVMWEGVAGGDVIYAFKTGATTVTFLGTSTGHNGWLHLLRAG